MKKHTIIALTALLAVGVSACKSADTKEDKKVVEKKVDPKAEEAKKLGLDLETWEAYQAATKELQKAQPDRNAALAKLKTVLEAKPEFAEAHYNAAMIYEVQGDKEKAREHLEEAREIDPSAPEYKVAMGRIYAETGKYDEAKLLFDEVVARDPYNNEARNNLAVLALQRGDLDKSKDYVIEILREDADNVPALMTLGLIYKERENLSLAKYVFGEKLVGESAGIDKDNSDAWNNLGLVYLMEDNTPAAVNAFEKANTHDDRYLESRLNLGAILIEYLDYERANTQFEQALKINPDSCVANLGHGATQYGLGNYEDAAERFEYYVSTCNDAMASPYERLAKLYEGPLGSPKKALDQYRKLLSMTEDSDKQTQYKAMINFLETQVESLRTKRARGRRTRRRRTRRRRRRGRGGRRGR